MELQLWTSEDHKQIKALQAALVEAEQAAADRSDSKAPRRVGDAEVTPLEAAEALNDFLTEAETRTIKVRVRNLGPLKLDRLRRQFTTEKEIRRERRYTDVGGTEVVETTFDTIPVLSDEWPYALVRACMVEPSFSTDEALDDWLEAHGSGTFSYLFAQLDEIHRETAAVGDPKSWRASALTEGSDET